MDRTRQSKEALDREQLDSLFWDNDSPGKFVTILETHEQEIGEILTSSNINILENFQNIIKTVIEEGRFKKREKKPSNDAIWFYMDCKKAKEEVTAAGKKVQSTPNDPSLRKILADKKKIFRKLVREKKRTHENKIFKEMLEFDRGKECKKFWDSLKRLNNEKELDYVSCISQHSWMNHFEKIRGAEEEPVYPADDLHEGMKNHLIMKLRKKNMMTQVEC